MGPLHKHLVNWLTNFGYLVACFVLYFLAMSILGIAVWGIIAELLSARFAVDHLLDEVGLVIFSIAVIDIGKYLMLEAITHPHVTEPSFQTSKDRLTKFALIIASALSLEGLVLTIEIAKENVTHIFYAIGVLVTAILYIIGLGVYQRLSSSPPFSSQKVTHKYKE